MVAVDPARTRATLSSEEVFEAVRPYVEKTADRIVSKHPSVRDRRDDLAQAGLIALWRMAGDYSPDLGTPLTFAARRIHGAMIDHLRETKDDRGIRARRVMRMQAAGEFVPACHSHSNPPPSSSRDTRNYEPAAPAPVSHSGRDMLAAIRAAGLALNHRDSLMLVLYYAHDKTMKEIADVLGINETRVSQLFAQLHERLREDMEERGLTCFA